MAFDSTPHREISKAYDLPLSYYRNFVVMQGKNHEYRQVLHTKSCLALLNKSQLIAYNAITKALDSGVQVIATCTGEGGSGKTFVEKAVANHIVESKQQYIATAMTGCASSNLFSMTVYSLLGWTNPKQPMQNLITATVLPYVKNRLTSVSTILLDEVGLCGSRTIACISRRMSFILGNTDPFGGKHVILFGDFSQVIIYVFSILRLSYSSVFEF